MLFREFKLLERVREETGIEMKDEGDVVEFENTNDEKINFPHLKNVAQVSDYSKALKSKVFSECEKGFFFFLVY